LQRASVICRYGIASRNAVREVKGIRAVLAKRIARQNGCKGEPVLAVMISSYFPSAFQTDLIPVADFGEGISQIQFPTKL